AGVIEAHDTDEFAGDEYGHDGLGLGADAFESGYTRIRDRRVALVQADAPSRAQLRGHRGELTLIARADRGVVDVGRNTVRGPLAHHDQEGLALWAAARQHDVDAIHMGRVAHQAQDLRNGAPYVRRLEEHPARLGGGHEQRLPAPQGLVDLAQLFRTGGGFPGQGFQ